MIRYQKDMPTATEENPAGGIGTMMAQTLFTPAETGGKTGMFAVVTLDPGSIVGEHLHTGEAEVYYILSGQGVIIEDGKRFPISAGDAELCLSGHSHGLENTSPAPIVFLAMVLKN